MATRQIGILGSATKPDDTGNVYQRALSTILSNDRYHGVIWAFKDTATRILLGGSFVVPPDYQGATIDPVIRVVWFTAQTSGDFRVEFDYKAIASGESADPSTDDESVAATVAAPGTTLLYEITDLTLDGTNLVAGDIVNFVLARDGAEAGPLDDIAGEVYVHHLLFRYSDT